MIVFLNTPLSRMRGFEPHHVGHLAVPRFERAAQLAAAGYEWAADNEAFSHFDETAYLRMLDHLVGVPGGRFVSLPDVVGDAGRTLSLFERWLPELRARGLPVALVAQDGLVPAAVPWAEIDALFVGGTTVWKLGPHARVLIDEARLRGRWVHIGRVNWRRRLEWALSAGADSCDGSGFSRFPEATLRPLLSLLDHPQAAL